MFARLLLVGVAWLAALFLFAALLQWSGSPPLQVGPGREGVTALARSLNQLRPSPAEGGYEWTVTKATSALRELVVEVDAINPSEAQRIAEHLVVGIRTQYDEVLIYVQALDPSRDPVVRRIEWTPRRGYLASAF